MIPSAIFAPCPTCGIFPGARHGYKCLCHQKPGDPCYAQALERGLAEPEPDYAETDEAGQLSLGVIGEQRAIPGLAKPRAQEG